MTKEAVAGYLNNVFSLSKGGLFRLRCNVTKEGKESMGSWKYMEGKTRKLVQNRYS